jgi:hypothetical protein
MNRNIFQPTTAQPASDLAWAFEQFKLGHDLFTAREHVTVCLNAQQRRGWYAALDAFAVATLPATSAQRLGF